MAVSTTFGYNASEDRIWISCAAWPQRVWLTRRTVREVVQAAVAQLESAPRAAHADDARPMAERPAAEHDASLNRPQPGERGHALQMGREGPDAPALASAVPCTRFALVATGAQIELVFDTALGQRRLQLSRVGLHRWLHALQMVLGTTGWADWPPPPDWLTRSYLPPALKSLLTTPPAGLDLGEDPDPSDAQAPPRSH